MIAELEAELKVKANQNLMLERAVKIMMNKYESGNTTLDSINRRNSLPAQYLPKSVALDIASMSEEEIERRKREEREEIMNDLREGKPNKPRNTSFASARNSELLSLLNSSCPPSGAASTGTMGSDMFRTVSTGTIFEGEEEDCETSCILPDSSAEPSRKPASGMETQQRIWPGGIAEGYDEDSDEDEDEARDRDSSNSFENLHINCALPGFQMRRETAGRPGTSMNNAKSMRLDSVASMASDDDNSRSGSSSNSSSDNEKDSAM